MIISNVSGEDLSEALSIVSKQYDNNVIWNNYERLNTKGTRFRVTLRVVDTHGKGARLSQSLTSRGNRRHLMNACWHVHGHFFENLLKINPNAVIKTGIATITKEGGNWVDRNISSVMHPLMYSEACECNKLKYHEMELDGDKLKTVAVKTVSQKNLSSECWMVQLNGLGYCKICKFKDTPNCGGQNIRKTGKNEHGLTVPIN